MTNYDCGHSCDILILDDNPLTICAYLEWLSSVGREGTKEFCFDCWSKKTINANQAIKEAKK